MHYGAYSYVSNPYVDYDISKIIFAGKERSAKFITEAKDAWNNDMFYDLKRIN